MIFVGILAAVHIRKNTGEIVLTVTPRISIDEVIDLGIVYKASTVVETIEAYLASIGESRASNAPPAASAAPINPPEDQLPSPPPGDRPTMA